MKYLALLRGINVGGNNKVAMKQLVEAMEKSDFNQVSTYINSGNIFFSSEKTRSQITSELKQLIKEEFGIDIKILLRDKKSLDGVVSAIPEDWENGKEMKCDVMFLDNKYDDETILKKLTIKDGIDDVRYVSGALIWKVDRSVASTSGMKKLVGTDIYAHMTVRNCNTVRKIHERMA